MKKVLYIFSLAGLVASVGAAPLSVYNSDFDGAHDTNPVGWTVTETASNVIGIWDDADNTSGDPVLAFKKSSTGATNSVEQSMTAIHPSVVAESSGNWTIGFDYGWRNSEVGGDAEFMVSLVAGESETILASDTLTSASNGIYNEYNQIGTASISLSYDTNAVPAGESVLVRIARTDAPVSNYTWQSTAFIDAVTVDALDLASTPAVGPPVWQEETISGPDAEVDVSYADTSATLEGLVVDFNGDAITYAKVNGADWLTVGSGGELGGAPTAGDSGITNTFTVSATSANGSAGNAILNIYVVPPPAEDALTLLNADFEDLPSTDGNNPNSWTTVEAHAGAMYAEGGAWTPTVALNMQDRAASYVEQEFLIAEATADSFDTFEVTMDLGWRADSGVARSITIEIWNVTDDISLASTTYDYPAMVAAGLIETKTFSLSYDNTAAGLAGDTIALRINNGGPNTAAWNSTVWIDNIEAVVAAPEVALPATILSITSQPGNIMRIVVDAPNSGGLYRPQAKSNLIIGDWGDVAHSVDGSAPWNVTNLSYVTEFESGTNEVIYVQANETQEFFEIIGN